MKASPENDYDNENAGDGGCGARGDRRRRHDAQLHPVVRVDNGRIVETEGRIDVHGPDSFLHVAVRLPYPNVAAEVGHDGASP